MSIVVATVEDSGALRASLATLINEAPGFCCAAAYSSAEEALREIPRRPVDVVLMDINLRKMSGVECTFRLKKILPRLQIVMLTVYDDSERIFEALKVGASGYLLKRTPTDEILKAIEEVHRGGAPMSSYIARKVVQSFARREKADLQSLSSREEQVLALVAKGDINKEIADKLGISLETVRSHLRTIYDKMHVRSRTEAAMKFFVSNSE
jgi:DNA-binding NarL/FixJ family response regulator